MLQVLHRVGPTSELSHLRGFSGADDHGPVGGSGQFLLLAEVRIAAVSLPLGQSSWTVLLCWTAGIAQTPAWGQLSGEDWLRGSILGRVLGNLSEFWRKVLK